MDKIQSQLPNFTLDNDDEEEDNSLSSIEEVDQAFCVIEHLSIEMLNSYRIRTATRIPGGIDSASSVGGVQPSQMSTCSTRAGGSFGESIVIDDDKNDSNMESTASMYSTSELPNFPTPPPNPWCKSDTLPHLAPTTNLLLSLAKQPAIQWTPDFKKSFEKWAPTAQLTNPQSWSINEKKNLIWYSYHFSQRNEPKHTPEEFFKKGGERWIDHIFAFWWKYFTSPEAPPLDRDTEIKTLQLPPPWIFQKEEYDILEYFSHSQTWKNKQIPGRSMMPSLLITAFCSLGLYEAKCPYIPFYRLVIDGGLPKITEIVNAIRQKLEENEENTNRPIPIISWRAQMETWERTPTEDLWIHESMEEQKLFEPNFDKWWMRHDSTPNPNLPSAVSQRHTLFLIFLQLRKAGIDIGTSTQSFFLTYKEHSFRQIQEHTSTLLPLSLESPEHIYLVQVPMFDSTNPDYGRVQTLINKCSWLSHLKPQYSFFELLPDFLFLAYTDEPSKRLLHITTFLEEGSTTQLARIQHDTRIKQALHSCEQGLL